MHNSSRGAGVMSLGGCNVTWVRLCMSCVARGHVKSHVWSVCVCVCVCECVERARVYTFHYGPQEQICGSEVVYHTVCSHLSSYLRKYSILHILCVCVCVCVCVCAHEYLG